MRSRITIKMGDEWKAFEPCGLTSVVKQYKLGKRLAVYDLTTDTDLTFCKGEGYEELYSYFINNYCGCVTLPIKIECFCNGTWFEFITGRLEFPFKEIDCKNCCIKVSIIINTVADCFDNLEDESYNGYLLPERNSTSNPIGLGVWTGSDGSSSLIWIAAFFGHEAPQFSDGVWEYFPAPLDNIQTWQSEISLIFLLALTQASGIYSEPPFDDLPIYVIEYPHGRSFNAWLADMYLRSGCGSCVRSDFFGVEADYLDPIYQTLEYQYALNNLHNLTIHTASDIINPDASDPAPYNGYNLTYGEMAELLNDGFDVHIGIVDGCIRIEHRIFWERLREGNTIILSNYDSNIIDRCKFTFDSSEIPDYIDKSWSNNLNSNSYEWDKLPINSGCALQRRMGGNRQITDTRTISAFETNPLHAFHNENYNAGNIDSDSDDDGHQFFIIANDINNQMIDYNSPLSADNLAILFNPQNEIGSKILVRDIQIVRFGVCELNPFSRIKTDLPINDGYMFIDKVTIDCDCTVTLDLYAPCVRE